ncbi:uncharacterized protein LOC126809776, partial [Patella vulgata]|uniref:uncharacterized protein LOC126809776 n=1 Tax=Patella vulgata TaxID=6465 RepID=UPI0024A84504
RMILQPTFKKNCPAHLKIRKIKIYPNYKFANDDSISNWERKLSVKKPDITDQGYFPIDKNIRNHIYIAKSLNRHSKVDQENFLEKVKEWELETTDRFLFRPSTTKVENGLSKKEGGNTLLYCHQTDWQRRLLGRYGQIVLLDATYKTMKYALPLFFLCVKTNHSYIVIGEFVIEDETIENIAEALRIFRDWNPEVHPNFFMMDYSLAEIGACECPDWDKYRYPCKHFLAIFRLYPTWNFSKLPESYRCSPFIILDACPTQETTIE